MAIDAPREDRNVLVLSTYFSPDVCGIAPIVTDLCEGLSDAGYRVTVLTSFPHYPEWKNKSGRPFWSQTEQQTESGVKVIRYGAFIPKNPSKIVGRLIYELSLLLNLLRLLKLRSGKFDVIYAVCPSAANIIYAKLRRLFTGEPVVIHVQDIPADAATASGLVSGPIGRLAGLLQRWLLRTGQSLSTISQPMAERIAAVTNKPVELTPNWLVGEVASSLIRFKNSSEISEPSEGNSLPRFLYSGNIGNKQGLDRFCQEHSKSSFGFCFTIHGSGSGVGSLEEFISGSGDQRFTIGPLLEADHFIDCLGRSDWFVITEKPGIGTAVMPSKLIPAVSLGIPILAICESDGALGSVVTEHDLGLRLGWEEIHLLPETLTRVSQDKQNMFSSNCIRWSQVFDRDSNLQKIRQLLTNCCQPVR